MNKIKKAIQFIFAENEGFSLENRLFLSSLVVGILTSMVGSVLNLLLVTSLPAAIIPLLLSVLLFIVYYFVRFKQKIEVFKVPIIITALIGISVIWVFNGGINGSNIMPGFVILILGLVVFPDRKKKYVFLLFVALNIVVYLIQFYRPDLITNYSSETERWIDSLFTIIYTSYFIFLIVKFVHNHYTLERNHSTESEMRHRLSEENLAEAQRIANIGSWEWDLNTNTVKCSKEMFRLFDIDPDTFDGHPESLMKVVHPDDIQFFKESLYNNFENANSPSVEYQIIHRNSSIHHVLAETRIDFDKAGNSVRSIGTVQDITKRKQVDEALRASERFLIETQLIARLGTYTLDVNSGKWTSSEMLNSIFGIEPDFDKTIETWISIIHPEWQQIMIDYFSQEVISDFSNFDKEYQIIRENDRAVRWVHGRGELKFDAQNRPVLMLGAIQDITERKQIEEDLIKAKEKAEESDLLKSAFLANMSHEIRTPMNGILGFAELMKEPNISGEEKQEYISIIEKSGTRMVNIINDIVDISKIESGQMKVSFSETNVNKQLEYLFNFYRPEAEQRGLRISFQSTIAEKESIIQTDRQKIYAILTNLVNNAIKFTHEGSIEFGCECGSGDPDTGHALSLQKPKFLVFYVKDTGIGIRREHLGIIFERFRQGSETLNRKYEGAGLGLSISKAYVEMLGGQIWVESEEGKGSTFYFTIPFTTGTKEKIESETVVLAGGEEKQELMLKILIVEDDAESAILLSKIVQKFSKEVFKARTGIEAVDICRKNKDINLILMDIQMPEMDGYEATRQIRQFNTDVIIIAQTAFALSGDKELALEVGCNDYISKPIKRKQLMETINKHFKI
ncbi:MAG: PAS domain-containing protein [Sulfuricurvum sp.]|nr:PAS domain-containing protein [Sulfuricurvum sp.]